MNVSIIGLGLIGGSLAIDLRARGFASRLTGVDANPGHAEKALERRLVDDIKGIDDALASADLVVLAVPVDEIVKMLPAVLNGVKAGAAVTDMGSTKGAVADCVRSHPKRRQFVASHPMAGTEHSGPGAAIRNLFDNKPVIICDKEQSDPAALSLVERMYRAVGMNILYMESGPHDVHAAYVSHISHISSFALALAVLEREKNEKAIFDLAGGGFSSTVRLAKSSPEMWSQIYAQNADNIIEVLDAYIRIIGEFREAIRAGDSAKTFALMQEANKIRKVLDR